MLRQGRGFIRGDKNREIESDSEEAEGNIKEKPGEMNRRAIEH